MDMNVRTLSTKVRGLVRERVSSRLPAGRWALYRATRISILVRLSLAIMLALAMPPLYVHGADVVKIGAISAKNKTAVILKFEQGAPVYVKSIKP